MQASRSQIVVSNKVKAELERRKEVIMNRCGKSVSFDGIMRLLLRI